MKIIYDRDSWILSKCKDKKVLHIGPCDWPYMEQKISKKRLLYSLIDSVCAEQLGVDLDKNSIHQLNSMDWNNSKCIERDMSSLINIDFAPEIIVFAETIEHLENPGLALDNLYQIMSDDTELIITTPNATRLENFITALLFKNNEHPDHKVSFTFSSLSHLLTYKKFSITNATLGFIPYFDYSTTWRQQIISKLFYIIRHFIVWPISFVWNYYAETLIFVVKK
jgi:hypothetical protein